jgi:uncharacterized protein
MEVLRYRDAVAFRRDGDRVLVADPARNQLFLGLLQTLVDEPHVYPSFRLWLADDGGLPVGLALQTEPHNVVLADPTHEAAVDALASAVVGDGGLLPGVVANLPWADRFAACVERRTGRGVSRVLREGVWELTAVAEVPAPPGAPRPATPRDRDLLMTWQRDFAAESLPADFPWNEAETERIVDLRLSGAGGGYWLWELGEPVSLSGFRLIPGAGARIGPVYTPPEHRGRGFATRLVADLSAGRLAVGDRACYLYTDLANPTSNAIYERIGYVKLCEAADVLFALAGSSTG